MVSWTAIMVVFLGSFMTAAASILLKKGSSRLNFRITEQLRNVPLIIGTAFYILGSFVFIYALSLERLSVLNPFSALVYIWVSLFSIKFLGEKINKGRITGIILILIGVVLFTYFAA